MSGARALLGIDEVAISRFTVGDARKIDASTAAPHLEVSPEDGVHVLHCQRVDQLDAGDPDEAGRRAGGAPAREVESAHRVGGEHDDRQVACRVDDGFGQGTRVVGAPFARCAADRDGPTPWIRATLDQHADQPGRADCAEDGTHRARPSQGRPSRTPVPNPVDDGQGRGPALRVAFLVEHAAKRLVAVAVGRRRHRVNTRDRGSLRDAASQHVEPMLVPDPAGKRLVPEGNRVESRIVPDRAIEECHRGRVFCRDGYCQGPAALTRMGHTARGR